MTASPAMGRCPICQRPLSGDPGDARLRPFCSKRCADIDLGRWFGGDYRVPGPPVDPLEPQREPGDTDASQNRSRRVDPDEGLG